MYTRTNGLRATVVAAALLLSACAAKQPVLYPNAHLQEVGDAAGRAAVSECLALAADYVPESSATEETAKSTAGGAAVGAVVGTAVGAVTGHTGRGAAIGAAGGGTRGLIHGLGRSRDYDPLTKRFVEQCLAERGFRVIGWK